MTISQQESTATSFSYRHNRYAYIAGVLAVILSMVQIVFQFAIALGLPIGEAAWGGASTDILPTGLRVISAVAAMIYLYLASLLAQVAGLHSFGYFDSLMRGVVHFLVVFLSFKTLLNFASPSTLERYLLGPFLLVSTLSSISLARTAAIFTENKTDGAAAPENDSLVADRSRLL